VGWVTRQNDTSAAGAPPVNVGGVAARAYHGNFMRSLLFPGIQVTHSTAAALWLARGGNMNFVPTGL
jgi:hypothetical protein